MRAPPKVRQVCNLSAALYSHIHMHSTNSRECLRVFYSENHLAFDYTRGDYPSIIESASLTKINAISLRSSALYVQRKAGTSWKWHCSGKSHKINLLLRSHCGCNDDSQIIIAVFTDCKCDSKIEDEDNFLLNFSPPHSSLPPVFSSCEREWICDIKRYPLCLSSGAV